MEALEIAPIQKRIWRLRFLRLTAHVDGALRFKFDRYFPTETIAEGQIVRYLMSPGGFKNSRRKWNEVVRGRDPSDSLLIALTAPAPLITSTAVATLTLAAAALVSVPVPVLIVSGLIRHGRTG